MRDRLPTAVVSVVVALAASSPWTLAQTPAPAVTDVLAEQVRALDVFLAGWLPQYAATVSVERYRQIEMNSRRDLESEFAAVRLDDEWVGVRDVRRVDGRLIPDREGRVERIFAADGKASMRRLIDRIAEESARFNLGGVIRSVNSPAMVLGLLDPSAGGRRVSFSDGRWEPQGSGVMWAMRFVERVRPALIRTPQGADMPAEGRVWLDAGGLARAEVLVWLRDPAGQETGRKATIAIDLVDDPAIGLRVPSRLNEVYTGPTGFVVVRGEATYTDYRRFDVQSREQLDRLQPDRPSNGRP